MAEHHDWLAERFEENRAHLRAVADTVMADSVGADSTPEADRAMRRRAVEAFLAASRQGNFDALLSMLDPDVVLRSDSVAVQLGAKNRAAGALELAREIRGALSVANTFAGRARAARAALIDGNVGAVWATGGEPRSVFFVWIEGGRIVEINLVADPEQLDQLDIEFL